MKQKCRPRPTILWLFMVLTGLLGIAAPSSATSPKAVQIGMVKSIFRDIPDPVVKALLVPFSSMMYNQTGVNGKIQTVNDPFELGEQMDKGNVQLGVFHGFEFAWVQERFPKLKAMMIAVNEHRYLSANLVVHKDSPINQFADLKGKKLSMPSRTREHCHLYVDRHCEKCGTLSKDFFSKVVKQSSYESALDDVVRGEVQGVVIDGLSLECYEAVKPGCFNRLKVVEKSEVFPAAVIAYREGSLDDETIKRFRDGLINANKNPKSRTLMTLWQLTAFESIPNDYPQILSNIRKAYPAPATLANKVEPANQTGDN